MAKNTKPAIRFKGFTDAWEQRKLGEIACSFEYGLNAAAKKYDGKNKYIRITDIDENSHCFNDDDLTSPDIDLENAERYKLIEGDILFARTGASVGKSYIYRKSDGLVYYAGFLIRGKIKDNYDIEFVFQNTLTDGYWNYISVTSQRSGQPGVNAQEYQEYVLKVPKFKEQFKLGSFFRNLDNLITLHQRKYDSLVNVKKAMLEKMFPKNGETVPEIRFKGFTDAWEQRKLGEICEKITMKNTNMDVTETFTNSAEFGIISQRDFFDHDIAKQDKIDGYYIVHPEDFVYNPRISVTAPVGPINRNKLGRCGVMSPLYSVFRPNGMDNTFLEQFFKSSYWHSFMRLNGDSGARSDRFSIKDSVFFDMPIPCPNLQEQESVGRFLYSIDNLITLHQRKLEKLKNIKKSCLEKMFV